jgi:hypothetical protein
MSRESESSPLFDKMDALLARHRGGAENIPTLLDEADDIPVLTEAVDEQADGDVLMFPPEEFAEEAVLIELTEQPLFEPVAMSSPQPVAEFLDLPLLDLAALSQANPWGASWEEEKIPDAVAAPQLAVVEASAPIQLISITNDAEWDDDQLFDSPAAEPNMQPLAIQAEPALLSERAIAELSATVAAQLGVEIATEVEQLTRQHFASLMSNFYEDTLRRLMSDMTVEIEQKLLPRVEELVKEELRKHQ